MANGIKLCRQSISRILFLASAELTFYFIYVNKVLATQTCNRVSGLIRPKSLDIKPMTVTGDRKKLFELSQHRCYTLLSQCKTYIQLKLCFVA
jgi:hypothetical protein